jgi:hypothetical protein
VAKSCFVSLSAGKVLVLTCSYEMLRWLALSELQVAGLSPRFRFGLEGEPGDKEISAGPEKTEGVVSHAQSTPSESEYYGVNPR